MDLLELDDKLLGVYYVQGGFYVMSIALGSRLKEEMIPWNVTVFVINRLLVHIRLFASVI